MTDESPTDVIQSQTSQSQWWIVLSFDLWIAFCFTLKWTTQNRGFSHFVMTCLFERALNFQIGKVYHENFSFSINYQLLFQHSFQHILQFSTCLEIWNMFLNTPWNIQHSFELALQFSTHTEIFNMLFQHSFQHILQFSTCLEIFNMFFNTPWNIQHSFELALQFSTCAEIFNTLFQHVLQFSEHAEIFSTCFFLQFSEHVENFNMLFYSFQNMLKISKYFFMVFNTLFQYVFKMCYRFQHTLKFSIHFQTWKFEIFTVKLYLNPSRNIWKILVRTSRTKNFKACWKPCWKFQSMLKITMTWPLCDPFHQLWNIITAIKIKSDIINENYRSLWCYMSSFIENLFFNLVVNFLYFLSNWINLLGVLVALGS